MGSNFKISVSCHHFGWAFPSSGKSRVDEGRPFAFKTRFLNFSHLGQTKKTAVRSNFTISVSCHHFGWAFPSSGKSRVDEGRPFEFKTRFFNFSHLGQTKKTAVKSNFTISVSCHHFGWAFPSSGKSRVDEGRPFALKTRFLNFSHLGQTKKTAVRSNFTISVSCHHFGWAFPSSGKSRVDEGRPFAFKTRFFNFSHLGQTKKTAVKSNFTISVSCHHFWWAFPSSGKSRVHESGPIALKTRFVKFPHRGEAKKQPWDRILQFRFHATILGGLFQAAEKAGFTKVVQLRSKRVLLNFPIGGNEKTPLGSNFKISISCHHFGWAFPSSGKSRLDEGRPIAFKTRFFNFSHLGQTKKTAVGSNFKISVSCHHFGWDFPSSGKSRVHESGPIAFKTRFVKFPHRGKTKKQPWDRILKFRFHATILGGLFQAAEKAGLTKVVQLRSKRVFSTFPIGAKRKNSLGIEFYNFRFMPPFCVGFSKQRKKSG